MFEKLFDYKYLNLIVTGVHEVAASNGRVVVSGHAANVGIVGWSMGGGHSPLGPTYGLGVDQILEVEVIGPDGSLIIANGQGTTSYSPGEYVLRLLY